MGSNLLRSFAEKTGSLLERITDTQVADINLVEKAFAQNRQPRPMLNKSDDYYDENGVYLGTNSQGENKIYRTTRKLWNSYFSPPPIYDYKAIYDEIKKDRYNTSYFADMWETIPNVIKTNDFVGWENSDDCMVNAKTQIAVLGYTTLEGENNIFMYHHQTGITNRVNEGINFITNALRKSEPLIIGVYYVGAKDTAPPQNADGTTYHYVVVVGMGYESGKGNYLQTFDNAYLSRYVEDATGQESRLYLRFDKTIGHIENPAGTSKYIVTRILPNKKNKYAKEKTFGNLFILWVLLGKLYSKK